MTDKKKKKKMIEGSEEKGGMEASTFGLPDIELWSVVCTKKTDGHKVNCANK